MLLLFTLLSITLTLPLKKIFFYQHILSSTYALTYLVIAGISIITFLTAVVLHFLKMYKAGIILSLLYLLLLAVLTFMLPEGSLS